MGRCGNASPPAELAGGDAISQGNRRKASMQQPTAVFMDS